jgi:hypothetical protein
MATYEVFENVDLMNLMMKSFDGKNLQDIANFSMINKTCQRVTKKTMRTLKKQKCQKVLYELKNLMRIFTLNQERISVCYDYWSDLGDFYTTFEEKKESEFYEPGLPFPDVGTSLYDHGWNDIYKYDKLKNNINLKNKIERFASYEMERNNSFRFDIVCEENNPNTNIYESMTVVFHDVRDLQYKHMMDYYEEHKHCLDTFISKDFLEFLYKPPYYKS